MSCPYSGDGDGDFNISKAFKQMYSFSSQFAALLINLGSNTNNSFMLIVLIFVYCTFLGKIKRKLLSLFLPMTVFNELAWLRVFLLKS